MTKQILKWLFMNGNKSSKLTAYDSFVLVENCFREEIISMSKLSEKSFT